MIDGYGMCSVVTPGGQLLISARPDSGLYKLGNCGLELLLDDIWPNGAWPNTCGPHSDGALFCAGKNCYLYNETTGEMGNIQYQKDYHYGGGMAYIDEKGAVAIGGESVDTSGGRIELLYAKDGDREKWHNITEAVPTDWDPERVQLPVEYKWFTVTKEPYCMYAPDCSGLMLFGGYGCEAEDENCGFYQESYITSIDTASCHWQNGCTLEAVTRKNTKIDRLIEWEMPNVHGYRTIDSVLDRDSGFLVHAQTFNCKGFGIDEYFCLNVFLYPDLNSTDSHLFT